MYSNRSRLLVLSCLTVCAAGCGPDVVVRDSQSASHAKADAGEERDADDGDDSDTGSSNRAPAKPASADAGHPDDAATQPGVHDDAGAGARPNADAGARPNADAGARSNADAGALPNAAAGASAPAMPSMSAPAAPGDIKTVVIETIYTIGVGGSVVADLRPVILFNDGSACRDMNFVVEGLDVAAHRAQYPKVWTQWEIIDNKYALKNGDKWIYLDFQLELPPNEKGLTLDNTFSRITGGGDTAAGGDVLIYAQSNIRLTADHKLAVGSFSAVTSSSAVFSNASPDQRGTYEVDGYALTIHWDNGKTTTTSFVWTAKDPKVFYLSGRSYVVLS